MTVQYVLTPIGNCMSVYLLCLNYLIRYVKYFTLNSVSSRSSCLALYACLGFRSRPGFLERLPKGFGAEKMKSVFVNNFILDTEKFGGPCIKGNLLLFAGLPIRNCDHSQACWNPANTYLCTLTPALGQ